MSTHTPIYRDFLVYQRLVIEKASTRQVAHELEISQTRVRQIVARFASWLQENMPSTDEKQDAAYLRLAHHIAADRVDHYLEEATELWHKTKHTKYANLILRLSQAQSKIPALPGAIEALTADHILGPEEITASGGDDSASGGRKPTEADEDEINGPASLEATTTPTRSASEGIRRSTADADRDQLAPAAPVATSQSEIRNPKSEMQVPPPLRDCSPEATDSSNDELITTATTHLLETTSANSAAAKNSARKAFLTPAHPAPDTAELPPITELKITPQKLTYRSGKRLNRRDRRRLQRLARSK